MIVRVEGLTRPDSGTVEIAGHQRTTRERGRTARLRRAKEVQMGVPGPVRLAGSPSARH